MAQWFIGYFSEQTLFKEINDKVRVLVGLADVEGVTAGSALIGEPSRGGSITTCRRHIRVDNLNRM